MAHEYDIKISRPLDRDYNVIGVNEGDDISMSILIEHDDWLNNGYNLTIYDEKTRDTLVSVSVDENPKIVTIDDFAFDAKKCFVVVEDRSDINDIETIETIAYIFFKKFKAGKTIVQQIGYGNYTEADDSVLTIPNFRTEYGEDVEVIGYITYTETDDNEIDVPYYNQAKNLV